ncbi:UNVERIFIED_CONTAM: hypothetical protein FKN15_068779 [Acipenser sinensis]
MGGKQSTAGRSRGGFPGVSTDDSAVPPAAHFGHYRTGGAMGLRSRSVSSVAGMGIDTSVAVPFGYYATRATGESERTGGGAGSDSAHGNGYHETSSGHHTDGMLYLGSRGSLADALPLHIAPRWFSAHSAQLTATTPALTRECEDKHTLYSEACACSHPRVTASEDNAALGQLTGKPVGARPDYRGRWCTVIRGHPGRPNPPSPGRRSANCAPPPGSSCPRSAVELDSRRLDYRAHPTLHVECLYWMRHSGAPSHSSFNRSPLTWILE